MLHQVDVSEERMKLQEQRLLAIAEWRAREIPFKEREYQRSWLKRGGVGAWITILRKPDRIEAQLEREPQYDIFAHMSNDRREEGITDDVRDFFDYLMLVLEEAMHRGIVPDILEKDLTYGDDKE